MSMREEKHTKYHVQRVIIRAAESAQDSLVLARDALTLLMGNHPRGLDDAWDAHDLEQLKTRLDEALGLTGEFFHYLS